MDNRVINKIKLDKYYTPTIEFEQILDSGRTQDIKDNGNSAAHPDLTNAMDGLIPLICEVCHLNDDWVSADVSVIGISFKHKDNGIGINVTMLGRFEEEGCVTMNTPYISPDNLPDSFALIVERIIKECELYLDGKEAQGSLFDSAEAA